MTIENFTEKFTALFENTDVSLINYDTPFRKLEEWDSLLALSVMAMIDEEYNVKLTGDEMRAANTIKELFEKVASKKQS
jgi:acyl carrier protein